MVKNFYIFGYVYYFMTKNLRKEEKYMEKQMNFEVEYKIKGYEKNSRQMPSTTSVTKEKDYCDLLYAWLQCNSERENMDNKARRRIPKEKIKWTVIEKDFTRVLSDGKEEKVMGRKTIAKYFKYLVDKKLIVLEDNFYYLTLLNKEEASLIEYNTLSKLMNVFQKNSISIYIYLFNRYYANGSVPFIATIKQIKDYI